MDGLIILGSIIGIILIFREWRNRKNTEQEFADWKKPSPSQALNSNSIELTGNGTFDYEIVGESHYQDNIKKALNLDGGRSSKSFKATLVHDNNNPHDKMAVAVKVNGYLVGYLSRGKARSYRKIMKDLGFEGCDGICAGTVWGGGKKKSYGIWLDYNPRLMRKKYE